MNVGASSLPLSYIPSPSLSFAFLPSFPLRLSGLLEFHCGLVWFGLKRSFQTVPLTGLELVRYIDQVGLKYSAISCFFLVDAGVTGMYHPYPVLLLFLQSLE